MAFELNHTFVSKKLKPIKNQDGEFATFRVSDDGPFMVLFPGRMNRRAAATFTHRVRVDDPNSGDNPGPGNTPLHGGFMTTTKVIPLTLKIFTPDGQEFTATEITVADLRKYRDLRGSPSGPWSYKLTGQSQPIFVDEDSTITNAKGTLGIGVTETVQSESAPPLINNVRILPSRLSFKFDLFRIGTFVAEISQLLIGGRWRGSMQLIDPDGNAVARTTQRKLNFDISLRTLDKSRDTAGKIRLWTLEVTPQNNAIAGFPHLSATVIASGRISIPTLKSRIDTLLGPRGSFIKIFGENKGGRARGRLKVTDIVAAETIDMHGLLEKTLEKEEQDAGVDPKDFNANTTYTIASKDADLKAGLKMNVSSLKVGTIDVAIGPGVRLGSAVPAIKLKVTVSGALKITFKGLTLATAKVRGGKFDMEIGIKLGPDGVPRVVCEVPSKPFDISISAAVKVALLATLGIAGLIGGMTIAEYVEHEVNEAVSSGARHMFDDPTIAPRILMTIFGAHLNYKPIRIVGNDILFEHVAPLEPDPKPTPGYAGAIGRSIIGVSPKSVSFVPPVLGDTWRADNLNKIDHIVVVMMENRSYDHVLGHRARGDVNDGADGLTDEIVSAIQNTAHGNDAPFTVRALREAGFPKNAAGLMTRLPKGVGHELADVAEQLSARIDGPNGRQLNSPQGFVDNFKPRLEENPQGVVPNDVLGFYDGLDLPFYEYLATNYAYTDRYFCSHPGPTLPNRMYSLTGDVQHDRYGFPILDNNNGDNFLLSRAPTIYDVLARKGHGFRVYESFPSVTMLRMFARYATNNTNIVRLDRLAADVKRGNLPAFTAIEPQMHAHPQDDDHPDADMLRGQIFLKKVYDTLRSNPTLWAKTMLIVTYDEHGGLYDHVIPPVADVISRAHRAVFDPRRRETILTRVGASNAELATATSTPPGMLTIPYGVRVPTFVVSPWTAAGKGPNVVLDHCSLLKTVLARFCGADKPFLSDRVHASHSFDAFLSESSPRMDVPPPPNLPSLPIGVRRAMGRGGSKILTQPLSRQTMRNGPVDYHELSGRWARQLGR